MNSEAGQTGHSRAGTTKSGTEGHGRDLIDTITDAWRRELPDLDQPEYELAKRVARLAALLEDALGASLAPWGLSKADYGVLTALRSLGAPYELRPTDLKIRLLLTSGGVANVINRLEKTGLVERVPDPADGRSSWVRLSSAGAQVAEDTLRAWSAAQTEIFRHVPSAFAQDTADSLRRILVALGDHEPPAPATR